MSEYYIIKVKDVMGDIWPLVATVGCNQETFPTKAAAIEFAKAAMSTREGRKALREASGCAKGTMHGVEVHCVEFLNA